MEEENLGGKGRYGGCNGWRGNGIINRARLVSKGEGLPGEASVADLAFRNCLTKSSNLFRKGLMIRHGPPGPCT
jgi:hypothetical protein